MLILKFVKYFQIFNAHDRKIRIKIEIDDVFYYYYYMAKFSRLKFYVK